MFRMETSDGSDGFDHAGTYDRVIPNELIEYTVADGRKTRIVFSSNGDATTVSETFEPVKGTPFALQREFCQAVLNKFRVFVEESFK